MKPRICFLCDRHASHRHDNEIRIPSAFRAAGWHTTSIPHEAVTMAPAGIGFVLDGCWIEFCQFDLIWLLGLGPRSSFLDRMQMLSSISPQKFVNSPNALLYLHAKFHAHAGELAQYQPQTHASCDAELLQRVIRAQGEVDWIIKPPAGSFGVGVQRSNKHDPQLSQLLRHATGDDGSRYTLIQHYLPQITEGEKRVLLVNGEILGCYLKLPLHGELANLAGGGAPQACDLQAGERVLSQRVSHYLQTRGCLFAAVDLCYPYLMEINLANPGGLATLEALYGHNAAEKIPAAFRHTP